jgi:hypothetical protein
VKWRIVVFLAHGFFLPVNCKSADWMVMHSGCGTNRHGSEFLSEEN